MKQLARQFNAIYARARSHKMLILLVLSGCVFLALLEQLLFGNIAQFDQLAYTLFVIQLRSDFLTPIMIGFSDLSKPIVLFAILFLVAVFAPGNKPGRCAALNLVLVYVLNLLLKEIIQRPRPEGFRLVSETGYSFPSGHSMVSMAFYGFLAWMAWKANRKSIKGYIYLVVFASIIACIGISRIYLGVHYASDVLAGFCVAILWLGFYIKVIAPVLLKQEGDHYQPPEPSAA